MNNPDFLPNIHTNPLQRAELVGREIAVALWLAHKNAEKPLDELALNCAEALLADLRDGSPVEALAELAGFLEEMLELDGARLK